MNAVVPILANDRDIKLVARTVAKDLTPTELDVFVHMARQWRLDPLRRQLHCVVYNKDKPAKRSVTFITGIDGYRAIADRTKCYRPGQRSVVTSPDAKDPQTNPYGIVSATASVWKYVQGEWHEFSETVYWEEFAPLKEIWAYNEAEGKDMPSGKFYLDRSGMWVKMGRNQLEKVAEAQALRRGWPDEYGNLYISEEMDQAKIIDITPSEQVARADTEAKLDLIGGKDALTVSWDDGDPLARVPIGQFWDASLAWMKQPGQTSARVRAWIHRNAASRGEAKAKAGHDYLQWWREVEQVVKALEQAEVNQETST